MDMFAAVKDFFIGVFQSSYIQQLWQAFKGGLDHIDRLLPLVLFALFAVIAFFGKRIYPVLRFLVFFVLGFGLGIYLLAPLMLGVLPNMPPWIIGLAAGIVLSVLSKFLYFVVLTAAVGYVAYVACFSGTGVDVLKGNTVGAIVAAAILVVVVFAFLKYFEMLLTSCLGGYGIAAVVRSLFDYTSFKVFEGKEWMIILGVTLLFAIPAFIVQIKTRKRY